MLRAHRVRRALDRERGAGAELAVPRPRAVGSNDPSSSLALVESTLLADLPDELHSTVYELVLAACESLVAYRRQHRSDLQLEPAASPCSSRDDDQPAIARLPARPDRCPPLRAAGRRCPLTAGSWWRRPRRAPTSGAAARSGAARPRRAQPTGRGDQRDVVHPGRSASAPTGGRAMIRYRVAHRTDYRYGAPISAGQTVAHLVPRSTPYQHVVTTELTVDPLPDDVDEHVDVYGNATTYSRHHPSARGAQRHRPSEIDLLDRPDVELGSRSGVGHRGRRDHPWHLRGVHRRPPVPAGFAVRRRQRRARRIRPAFVPERPPGRSGGGRPDAPDQRGLHVRSRLLGRVDPTCRGAWPTGAACARTSPI